MKGPIATSNRVVRVVGPYLFTPTTPDILTIGALIGPVFEPGDLILDGWIENVLGWDSGVATADVTGALMTNKLNTLSAIDISVADAGTDFLQNIGTATNQPFANPDVAVGGTRNVPGVVMVPGQLTVLVTDAGGPSSVGKSNLYLVVAVP